MKKIEIIKSLSYRISRIKWNPGGCVFFGVVIFTLIMMNGCNTNYHLRTWRSVNDFDRSFNKILIAGLIHNESYRSYVERELLSAARRVNLTGTNSMRMFPPEVDRPFEDIDTVLVRLKERGFGAILTVAIIDTTAARYIPPERTYVPREYYNRLKNYYYRTYEVVYKPGYFGLEDRYFLETNLFDVETGALIWSGRSYTFLTQDLEFFLPRYSRKLFKELQKSGIIDK
jgi:hypothetical protein